LTILFVNNINIKYNINRRVIVMKKITVLLLMMVLGFTLAGCKPDDIEKDPLDDILASNPTTELTGDTLRVGMDLRWRPFETIDVNGDPIGISVDMAYELGLYLNRPVQIVDLEFGSLITAIETEQIDLIIASMSISAERAEKINFSDPYFYFPLIPVMNKDFNDDYTINSKEDLFAITDEVTYVGPKSFITLDIALQEATNPKIKEVNDSNAAVLEVVTGSSDVFIISASSAAAAQKENDDTTVILWDTVTASPIGMGMNKNDTALLTEVNEFISHLGDTDGVYDKLAMKWDVVVAYELPGQGLDFYTEADE